MSIELATFIIGALVVVSTVVLAFFQRSSDHALEKFKDDLSREQAKFNSDLQHQLNHLSVDLEQRIQRLRRARYLTSKLYTVTVKGLTNGVSLTSLEYAQFSAYLGEFEALSSVIGDKELIDLSRSLPLKVGDPSAIADSIVAMHAHIRQAQIRIYTLLGEVAKSA